MSHLYLQQEADGAFAGLQQELLEANTEHLTLQSVPHRVTHTQLVADLLQSPVPAANTHCGLERTAQNSKEHLVSLKGDLLLNLLVNSTSSRLDLI